MSEAKHSEITSEETAKPVGPIGLLRLSPTVSFGLRAAALAGLVVTAGAATAVGFGGLFDDPSNIASWPFGSTCCIEDMN